jgi:hypothetical protein
MRLPLSCSIISIGPAWLGFTFLTGCVDRACTESVANSIPAKGPIETIAGYESHCVAGFVVYVADDLAGRDKNGLDAQALAALGHDLQDVIESLPTEALSKIRDTRLFVEFESDARDPGFSGRGVVYHVSKEWLAAHGFIAEKAAAIEIANVRDYLSWREHQPSMVLHELAHTYYWIVGPEIPALSDAYEQAVQSEMYEHVGYVLDRDASNLRRAYALHNEQEYFAELTEAYFGRNDYFPFVREELRDFDPAGFAMIEAVWGSGD